MRYERDFRYGCREPDRGRGEWIGRGEYGAVYEAPYRAVDHGYALGYAGGALRSRGSYQAGQLRSGLNPDDAFEFEWGEGYVGGRGYGGTNYDLDHGYRIGGARYPRERGGPPTRPSGAVSSPATRGGYAWGEEARAREEPYGPARYGYGPYFERLRRRPRPDSEIREDVEEAIFYDTWIDADRIEVSVDDGVVTLTGTLRSFDEVRYATDDAWDVDGVRGVRSELTVHEPGRRGWGEAASAPASASGGTAAGSVAPESARPEAVVQPERSRQPADAQARGRTGGRRGRTPATATGTAVETHEHESDESEG